MQPNKDRKKMKNFLKNNLTFILAYGIIAVGTGGRLICRSQHGIPHHLLNRNEVQDQRKVCGLP